MHGPSVSTDITLTFALSLKTASLPSFLVTSCIPCTAAVLLVFHTYHTGMALRSTALHSPFDETKHLHLLPYCR